MNSHNKFHCGIRYLLLLLAVWLAPACGGDSPGSAPDTTPPNVSFSNPANAAVGVGLNTKLTATFDKAMTASTIAAAFTVQDTTAAAAVPGTATYDVTNHIVTFAPTGNLIASHAFSTTITTAVKDLAGNAMAANFISTFNTGTTSDITPPTVSSTTPSDTLAGVAINRTVNATFSKVMDSSTISVTTFTLMGGPTSVSGTVSYAGATATLQPASSLIPNTLYTATVTTGVKDLAGNALAVNKVWTFTTGATAATGPARVDLGMAGNYVILAKSGIDTVATSAVTGDLGASPVAATGITHFSLILDASGQFSTSTQVTGKIYAADYATPTPTNLSTAVSNMLLAFADAAGRAPDVTNLGAGNIGGLTLYPGVFQWGTDVTIPTDVTLSGGPNDVWIFQIAGNLSMAGAKNVVLSGGALAKNIFWQVAGGAGLTVGAAGHFEGIVLAKTAINVQTGASVNGRLLAQTAVNIQVSTVTQPAP
jgi:hypothetical protein